MKKGKYDKNPAIFFGKGHTNAFGVYIGHKICHLRACDKCDPYVATCHNYVRRT